MGHLRFGRIYKTRRWSEVINLLESDINNVPRITSATLRAAEGQLSKLGTDPVIGYCIWLLTRLTWSARSGEFLIQLENMGIDPERVSSTFTFISNLTDVIRRYAAEYAESSVFTEISSLSFRQALTETIAEYFTTLFGTRLEDIQQACRAYSTKTQFSVLVRRFFTHFLSRTLTYFLNKELSNHIGMGRSLENIDLANQFNDALRQHAYQSTKIIEEFAGGWYSKHNWEAQGKISEDEAQRFVAFALRKLRMELEHEG